MILAENGMDYAGNITFPKALYDPKRISYCRSYLQELKKAVDDGADVVGYFTWSLLDNFEWRSGFTSRFGIIYVDYNTLKRYPKLSAYWFMNLLRRPMF
ncbi:Beta-glucosidase 44 [Datura stramonium]|uniref:Beta-glucosidase 44 n=1 Tax=Datura stramonium TaxID=4076 RepID=A0ABS8RY31_DATST|nr:Beta-glucosidase 44 [Datura stramonium]